MRSVTHATLVIERFYDAAPARVFAAWADPNCKARWFSAPGAEHELDFRIGGREVNRHGRPGEAVSSFRARYRDIVADERIVYTYEMYADDTPISVSVVTVELRPEGGGTRLVFTEQAAFLDAQDTPAAREGGAGSLLDALGEHLKSAGRAGP
jgi:uncharacterized protein YndB with AHSA1/START domain